MGAVLGMLASEAPAAGRLSLLEALPAAGLAARQRVARSRPVCGLLAAWAGAWADVVDGDEAALEALLRVRRRQGFRIGVPEWNIRILSVLLDAATLGGGSRHGLVKPRPGLWCCCLSWRHVHIAHLPRNPALGEVPAPPHLPCSLPRRAGRTTWPVVCAAGAAGAAGGAAGAAGLHAAEDGAVGGAGLRQPHLLRPGRAARPQVRLV
jgi:hypothetical protein